VELLNTRVRKKQSRRLVRLNEPMLQDENENQGNSDQAN